MWGGSPRNRFYFIFISARRAASGPQFYFYFLPFALRPCPCDRRIPEREFPGHSTLQANKARHIYGECGK